MKAQEIRELSSKEILEKIGTERATLSRMKFNHAISPLENPNKIKESRKNIARMLTELRSRELNQKA